MSTPGSAPGTDEPHVLRREFSLWSAFAFAFAFISPIVALYGIFGLALAAAGPSFWWGFALVFGGQLLVALVFAMLVSRWPLEGSIYQWSRRLLGTSYGWLAGWVYMWTLVIAMATVALGAAGFVANIAGVEAPSGGLRAVIALVILVGGTAINLIGRGALKVFMTASIVAEVIGSVGLGTWLLLFHRQNSISVLFDGGGPDTGAWAYLSGPFLIAVAFIGFSFVGFESAGAIAEEVHQPRRYLPKAVLFSLTFIALVVAYSSLAIILAIPDLDAVAAGSVADPVYETLTAALGHGIAKPVEVLFVIGFIASFLALQTSASRVIWAYARDGALPAATALARLRGSARIPVLAILVTTVVGGALFGLSIVAGDIYSLMVNFTTGGFYLAFLFPLIGFVVVLARRQWSDGAFSLGRATVPVAVLAAVWAVLQMLNISWPRPVYDQRYLDWSVWIGVAVVLAVGIAILVGVRGRIVGAEVAEELETARA
ncbi:amino acid permease [Mycolicibacterium canariasense]|uniref:Amino acid permease n=1 Tax=Mycolicibacterium canariasense TaxID=228230 RepID=A0A124E2Q9_MYCCR|nr:APC family permease [Mycolicibacterium canariasense]MCV7209583.1 amino acid permease [Mycolicibacterium canariasense]ORU99516.1 amino acid permease [Mycolicibacterium canariasense]GAS97595.1 amino acid permease [Mycolicibacterium canariasense]